MSITHKEIERVMIKWEIEGEPFLQIMLSANGSVNRMGDGEKFDKKPQIHMGFSEEPLLEMFLKEVPPELFTYAGRYTMPDPKGERASLEISFTGKEIDTGVECTYGTESEGPPEEMISLVELALDLTDSWIETKKRLKN